MFNIIVSAIVGAAFGGALLYGLYWEKERRAEKTTRLSERDSAPLESIYNEFYRHLRVNERDFEYLWKEIGALLRLEPERLRPTDRFDGELRPVEGKEISDELEDLYDFLESLSESRGKTFEPRTYNTLDDVIRAFALKES
jgi:hypothetical protein